MKYTDILVNSTTEQAQKLTQQVFQVNGFETKWSSATAGKATKGSKGMNIAFGALSQYYEMDFEIATLPDKKVALRLYQSNTGLAGGLLGAHKVKKQYEEIIVTLSNWFKQQGMFAGRNPP